MRPGLLRAAALAALAACRARPDAATPDTAAAREAREAMLFTVATRFRESSAALAVDGFERVTWRDACLEIRRRGACPATPTPGYRLRFRRGDARYEVRAPLGSPADVELAAAPDPRVGTPALTWTWDSAPRGCTTLIVTNDGRPVLGACDGPLMALDWPPETGAGEEWAWLHRRFAPFQLRDGDRALDFAGAGAEQPSPAWRRAIATWAALRWSDVNAGRTSAGHGRAMAFRRPVAGRPGYCEVLEVTEYGTAYAGAARCEGGGGEPGRRAWLSDALWEELAPWLDAWAPYSDDAAGLYFFGHGARPVGAEERRRLADWAARALSRR